MPIPNCRSSLIGGFLHTLIDLTKDTPHARSAIMQAREDIAGDFEPDLEENPRKY